MPFSIVLYEDNPQLRESVSSMVTVNDSLVLAGAFGDARNVEEQIKNLRPDLILMDIDMPSVTGIEAVKKIRRMGSAVPVIMLTVFDDNIHVFDAICSGASGYLLKKHISTRLFEAVEDALTGGAPMSPSVAKMVINALQQSSVKTNPYGLTQRENDVLTSLSQGNSYKLIAADCGLSIHTVRTHIRSIYEKLHVHSQTEAVAKAINEKLTRPTMPVIF